MLCKLQLRYRVRCIHRAMFTRLRLARYMKTERCGDLRGQRAAIHHFALRDRVNPAGLTAQYPMSDLLSIEDINIAALADGMPRSFSV